MSGDWSEWAREDWNLKLLEAVFSGREDAFGPVTKINATEHFLAKVANAESNQGLELKNRFIDLHKGHAWRVRSLFDASILYAWNSEEEPPQFFSQLYLTLLVASATEETHDEGNFRRRLSILLGMDRDRDYITSDLPRLWSALAKWTEEQFHLGNNIRPLRLPETGHETIIGYSKRLAFPMYRDEVRLSALLSRQDISSESPVEEVLNVVGGSIDKFSANFGEEYLRFRTSVEKGDPDAAETPFWNVLEEITWDYNQSNREEVRAKVRIELEVSSGSLPSFELLVDRLSVEGLPTGWRIDRLPVQVDDFSGYLVFDESPGDVHINRAILDLDNVTRILFGGNHVESAIRQGCLCFTPGESIGWLDSRCLPSSGMAWLVMRHDIAKDAKKILTSNQYGLKYWEPIPGAEDWFLVGPLNCDEDLSFVASRKPFNKLTVFRKAISRSTISIRNAIRMQDGILFLKPMIPVVSSKNTDELFFSSALDGIGNAHEMARLQDDEQKFCFPIDVQDIVKIPATLNLTAYRDKYLIQAKRINIVGTCTSFTYRLPTDLHSWLIQGAFGQLTPVNDDFTAGESFEENPVSELAMQKCFKGQKPGNDSRDEIALGLLPKVEWHPLESFPDDWSDVFECLVGLFSCRRGIDYTTAIELVTRGLDLESKQVAHSVVNGLISNYSLAQLFSRRWRGQRFFARQPVLHLNKLNGGTDGRIVGLLSKLMRTRLSNEVRSLGLKASIAVLGDWSHVGAIRVEHADEDLLKELAGRMGFELVEDLGGDRLSFLESPNSVLSKVSSLVDTSISLQEKRYWDTNTCSFMSSKPKSEITMEVNYLEKQQPIYLLKIADRPVWASQSREWSSLIAQFYLGRKLWKFLPRGVVATLFALPIQMAQHTIFLGSGVCGTDWKSGYSQWYYPFGRTELIESFLRYWISFSRNDSTAEALSLWANAMGSVAETKSKMQAFRKRYN